MHNKDIVSQWLSEIEEKDFDSLKIEEYYTRNLIVGYWDTLEVENIRTITQSEIECIHQENKDLWEAYYSKYDGSCGFISVTRPIIADNGKKAIFEEHHSCGWLCCASYIVILEKLDEKWVTKIRFARAGC